MGKTTLREELRTAYIRGFRHAIAWRPLQTEVGQMYLHGYERGKRSLKAAEPLIPRSWEVVSLCSLHLSSSSPGWCCLPEADEAPLVAPEPEAAPSATAEAEASAEPSAAPSVAPSAAPSASAKAK